MKEDEKKIENRYEKERFAVELTINDNIICQRYFKIPNFKDKALHSSELVDTIRESVHLIQEELKDKTRLYLDYTAPQIFADTTEMEQYLDLVRKGYRILEVPSLIMLRNEEKNFVWNGENAEVYEKYINRNDYIKDENVELPPCVLKFTFSVDKRPVCSIVWDGNDYPRFIRTNIDLTNSKNKYRGEGQFSPFEAAMVDVLNKNRKDLIVVILNKVIEVCSYDNVDNYTTMEDYGEVTYNLNPRAKWRETVSSMKEKYAELTDEYFKTLY